MVKSALKKDEMYDEDLGCEPPIQDWLKGERNTAKLTQIAEGPVALREWVLDKYAYGLELERRKKARLAEAAVEEFSASKTLQASPQAASLLAASTAARGRSSLDEREAKDEQGRRSWAKRALLVKSRWLGTAAVAEKQQSGRVATQLLSGLRMRTIRQKVLTI